MNESQNQANENRRRLPAWRKYLAIAALIIGGIGLALQGIAYFTQAPPGQSPGMSAQSLQSRTYLDGDGNIISSAPVGETQSGPIQVGDWSALFMKLGFSFFVGFSIGFAVSAGLRLAVLTAGIIFLLLFGLQYAGLITVNWHGMESWYDALIAWLQPRIGSFREFITSNLPASSLAAAGLFVGFKR
jgi:uncharacterized membrane protein (Fun14 family)